MELEKHHLLSILESMEDPVIVVWRDSTITYVNSAYSRQFNVPKHKLIGRKLSSIEEKARILDVLKSGEALINDYSYVHSLKKHIYANITPLLEDGELVGAVTIMKDISEARKLQEELDRYQTYSIQLEGQLDKSPFALLESQESRMKSAVRIAHKVSGSDATVFLYGESGVGKEIFARAIHETSTRKNRPFIPINMASIPETLFESELFGYEDGSFTGSRKGGKKGLMELANKGTLFLDEIGDMPMNVQAKLLRVVQERHFHKVGSTKPYSLDIRIICATNRDLPTLIKQDRFREDLYYRLYVVPIHIPPLRERKEDIPYIVSNILCSLISKYGKPVFLNDHIYEVFHQYDWPGNIRELYNVLERMITVCSHDTFMPEDIPDYIRARNRKTPTLLLDSDPREISKKSDLTLALEEAEKKKLQEVIRSSRNRTDAIQKLGISRKSFYAKLKKYGIYVNNKFAE